MGYEDQYIENIYHYKYYIYDEDQKKILLKVYLLFSSMNEIISETKEVNFYFIFYLFTWLNNKLIKRIFNF